MISDRWLYGWATGYAAVGAASLLIPLYALELGAGATLVGLMASTAAFAGVPGAVLWGKIASETGRKRPFVLVALAATAGVLGLLPLVSTPWVVLVLNAALWFAVSAAAPVLNLIVVEGVPANGWERRFGLLNHYQGYGWLAGLLAGAGWTAAAPRFVGLSPIGSQRWFFLLGALAAATGFAVVRVWYPDRPTISAGQFEKTYHDLPHRRGWGAGRYVRAVPFGPSRLYWSLRSVNFDAVAGRFPPQLARYLAAVTLCFVAFSVFFGPLPAYLADASYATGEIFALFVLSSAGSAMLYVRAGELATERDIHFLQSGALTTRAACFPLVALVGLAAPGATRLVAAGVLFTLVGFTWAVISVTATGLVSRLAPESVRGDAFGVYAALAGVGGGVGSALGGALADQVGYVYTFGAAGVLVLVGVAAVLASRRRLTPRL